MNSMGGGLEQGYSGAGGATAAAISLMHALPLQFMPPCAPPAPPSPHHWDPAHHHAAPDKQVHIHSLVNRSTSTNYDMMMMIIIILKQTAL